MSQQDQLKSISAWRQRAISELDPEVLDYLEGGADDQRTLCSNESRFSEIAIRTRRLVNVSRLDTTVDLFGERWPLPIALAPVGLQAMFHSDAELAAVRGAATRGLRSIASTVSSAPFEEISEAAPGSWFQLYPTADRAVTESLVARAEAAGSPLLVLTVDLPVLGNRERGVDTLHDWLARGRGQLGNFERLVAPIAIEDPTLDWSFIGWLRRRTTMKIVLKGITTREDTSIAINEGVDGLIVSNHGGRQEESDRATIACLPEVAEVVAGRIPLLLDGGIRRGTDIFKSLALGADAVCVGRPYIWGLAAEGQSGVEAVLDLLGEELRRIMQLAGTPSLAAIDRSRVEASAKPFV